MKKITNIISGSIKILGENRPINKIPKTMSKKINDLFHMCKGNFEIGITQSGEWCCSYALSCDTIATGRESLKNLKNRLEYIFDKKTKEIRRKESVVYG